MTTLNDETFRRSTLRYDGTCRGCGATLRRGTTAIHYRSARQVACLDCAEGTREVLLSPDVPPVTSQPAPPDETCLPADLLSDAGTAGASARREHDRRAARREAEIRQAHPRLGGLILAVTSEPPSTRSWAVGARGEELLAKRLDAARDTGVHLLHDRRIPRSQANIDHVAISAGGVFVIDAKRYRGRPELKVEGGIVRKRTESLTVGGRDRTKLVTGAHKQVRVVADQLARSGLAEVPVTGVLCFVEADWPLFGGAFVVDGVHVLWPKRLVELVSSAGSLSPAAIEHAAGVLMSSFPSA